MKNIKRIITLLLAVAVLISAAMIPASAGTTDKPRLIDKSGKLTDDQEKEITSMLEEFSEDQKCDIVILLVDDLKNPGFSFDGTTADYADTFYDTNGYDKNGVLVLIVQKDENGKRTIYFSTSGKCKKRLSESEWNSIIDDVTNDIKNEDYYSACKKIANGVNDNLTPSVKWYMLPLAILIGFAIAMIIMLIIRSKLKTVAMQRGAANYIRSGSMVVTAARDTYLYSTVTRTKREKNNSGSHTSSGGGSHSGGGRSI